MSEFQNATEPPKPLLDEAAREALSAEFENLGLQFSGLHPTIRAVMERAAVSTAHAKQQVESFLRVVAMADQYSLTDEQKEYALVRAYEQHAEHIAKSQEVVGSCLDASQPSPAGRSEAPVPDGPPVSYSRLQRLWNLLATREAETGKRRCTAL